MLQQVAEPREVLRVAEGADPDRHRSRSALFSLRSARGVRAEGAGRLPLLARLAPFQRPERAALPARALAVLFVVIILLLAHALPVLSLRLRRARDLRGTARGDAPWAGAQAPPRL